MNKIITLLLLVVGLLFEGCGKKEIAVDVDNIVKKSAAFEAASEFPMCAGRIKETKIVAKDGIDSYLVKITCMSVRSYRSLFIHAGTVT